MFLLAGFCNDTKSIWILIGNLLAIFKTVIPLLIIVFGVIDLGKAAVASKPDEIKNAAKNLGFRLLAGILIFFIPTIVSFAFTLAEGFNADGDFETCKQCVENPKGC